jgi:aspartate/methionine/tyrosine aminotransferase
MIPGTSFGAKEWVRISYACSMEELEKGAERLKKAFGEL